MLLIYGAYGYTGELIAKRAVELGLRPILSGRNPGRLAAVAAPLGLEQRVAALDDAAKLRAALSGVSVVLHCAGPFVHTSRPMLDACLEARAHYLDITGEIAVFEALARRDEEARAAGIMVLPGVGFDVVPSDCLAAHLKQRLPSATRLRLGILSRGGISHGTATTMLEHLDHGAMVREGGKLKRIRLGSRRLEIDYGRGPVASVAVAWGDVGSAWYSTKIPNIEVYFPVPRRLRRVLPMLSPFLPIAALGPVRRLLQRRIDRVRGPSDDERAQGSCVLWGEVSDDAGAKVAARLHTPEGYTLTVEAALHIAQKVASAAHKDAHKALNGAPPVGFHTPSSAFGAGLVLELSGVHLEDEPLPVSQRNAQQAGY